MIRHFTAQDQGWALLWSVLCPAESQLAAGNGALGPDVQPTELAPLPDGEWALATRLTHPRAVPEDPYHATVAPLYQTATFQQVG